MKKRYAVLAILMAFLCVLSFSACGGMRIWVEAQTGNRAESKVMLRAESKVMLRAESKVMLRAESKASR